VADATARRATNENSATRGADMIRQYRGGRERGRKGGRKGGRERGSESDNHAGVGVALMRATPGQRCGQHLLGRLGGMFTPYLTLAVWPSPAAFAIPMNDSSFSAPPSPGAYAFRNAGLVQEHGSEQERHGTENSAWSRNGAWSRNSAWSRPGTAPWSGNGTWSGNMPGPPGAGPWTGNGSVRERGRSRTALVRGGAVHGVGPGTAAGVQEQRVVQHLDGRSAAGTLTSGSFRKTPHSMERPPGPGTVPVHGARGPVSCSSPSAAVVQRLWPTGLVHGMVHAWSTRWSTRWSTSGGQRRVHAEVVRPDAAADPRRHGSRGRRRVAARLRAPVGRRCARRCRGTVRARAAG
jgi:hypothetical protein